MAKRSRPLPSPCNRGTTTGLAVPDWPRPDALPDAGNVDFGYLTGTTTVWSGGQTTDESGAYNLLVSGTFTADSDGGALDPSDVANLQIALKRNIGGPRQLRVTAVYVEVGYTP